MTPPRPKTEAWSVGEMCAWLQHLQEQADEAYGSDSAYVHPRPLRFKDEKQKNEWIGYIEGAEEEDSFGRLEKAKKGGRATWVAVVVGPCESYVGKPSKGSGKAQWELPVNHMWAVAVVNRGKKGDGKELFIFDCDAVLPKEGQVKHAKDLETQLQKEFVAKAKTWDFKLSGVSIGNAGEERTGKDECVATATEWVEKMALAKGEPLEEGDPRFACFAPIGMNT